MKSLVSVIVLVILVMVGILIYKKSLAPIISTEIFRDAESTYNEPLLLTSTTTPSIATSTSTGTPSGI